ncbi:radical SAM protein [Candidatus Woesearchaeota archaeon]|nr:radical SAM protein [Candidatus Woesearchaeota archaeon]
MVIEGYFHIKLNNNCNCNCNFCADSQSIKTIAPPSFESIKKKIDIGFEKGFRQLIITGGEPTISEYLLETIRYAKLVGFSYIQLVSNARMLSNPVFLNQVIESGVTKFQISYFAHDAKLYDSITKVPGSYKQLTTALLLLKARSCEISFNSVITRQNYKFLLEMYLQMLAFNSVTIQFSFLNPIGNAAQDFDEIVPKYTEVAGPLQEVIRLNKVINPDLVQIENIPFCFIDEKYHYLITDLRCPKSELGLRRLNKTKDLDICVGCKYYDFCSGIWKKYVEVRGTDF